MALRNRRRRVSGSNWQRRGNGLLRYATARPRLAASIVGRLGRDVGLAELKAGANRCTIQAGSLCYFASGLGILLNQLAGQEDFALLRLLANGR